MPTKDFVKFQQRREALATLDRAKSRLRKHDGRKWPFQPGEFEAVKLVVEDHAREVLGPVEFARVQGEVAKAHLTARTTRGELNKAAEETTTRLAVKSTESLATSLIGALRKRAKRERP